MARSCISFLTLCLILAALCSLGGCNGARNTAVDMIDQHQPKGFMIETIQNADRKRNYGLFIPLDYNPSTKYPVIIFLHGLGEGDGVAGNTAKQNLTVGLGPIVADKAKAEGFTFICIFPQSNNGHWGDNSEAISDVIACLNDVSHKYSVDANRVSLTGFSTGGYGTWVIGAKYRELFAALVPLGSSDRIPAYADLLTDMPIRSYHDSGDWIASMWNDESMCNRVNMLGGRADFYKTHEGGHNCWEYAYGKTDLFDWLLEQKRQQRGSTVELLKTHPQSTFTTTAPPTTY